MTTYLEIKVDTNDADYVTEMFEAKEEVIERVKRIWNLIPIGRHNWGTNEMRDIDPRIEYENILSEEDIEWFDGMMPHPEYGFHTIESIRVLYIEKIELL
jgi:hypothetical protein